MDGGSPDNIPSVHTVKPALILHRLCQLLCKFQQYRSGNPLVGVMGSGIDHLSFSFPDYQCPQGSSKCRGGQYLGAEKGIGFRQTHDCLFTKIRCHGNIGSDNSQIITSR